MWTMNHTVVAIIHVSADDQLLWIQLCGFFGTDVGHFKDVVELIFDMGMIH